MSICYLHTGLYYLVLRLQYTANSGALFILPMRNAMYSFLKQIFFYRDEIFEEMMDDEEEDEDLDLELQTFRKLSCEVSNHLYFYFSLYKTAEYCGLYIFEN